jgi:hypothetical protein
MYHVFCTIQVLCTVCSTAVQQKPRTGLLSQVRYNFFHTPCGITHMPLRREPSGGVVQDMALACFRWAAGAARFFLAPCRPPSTKMWEGGMERKPEAAPKRRSASALPQEEPTEECIEPYAHFDTPTVVSLRVALGAVCREKPERYGPGDLAPSDEYFGRTERRRRASFAAAQAPQSVFRTQYVPTWG